MSQQTMCLFIDQPRQEYRAVGLKLLEERTASYLNKRCKNWPVGFCICSTL